MLRNILPHMEPIIHHPYMNVLLRLSSAYRACGSIPSILFRIHRCSLHGLLIYRHDSHSTCGDGTLRGTLTTAGNKGNARASHILWPAYITHGVMVLAAHGMCIFIPKLLVHAGILARRASPRSPSTEHRIICTEWMESFTRSLSTSPSGETRDRLFDHLTWCGAVCGGHRCLLSRGQRNAPDHGPSWPRKQCEGTSSEPDMVFLHHRCT